MTKKNVLMILCVIMFSSSFIKAQNLITEVKAKVIPMALQISNLKTTNLIFPYAIKSVDRGSRDVLVQKAKGVENILQVKAASDSLKETNLTVVTGDGTLYSFNLNYLPYPSQLNLSLGKVTTQTPWALFSPDQNNDAKIHDLAEQLMAKKRIIKNIRDQKDLMEFSCLGMYIRDDIFYFQLEIENKSHINYSVDQLRLSIRDQKKPKRTASQEISVEPLFISGNKTDIGSVSLQVVTAAVPKFTIPDKKVLIIQLMEKNGGRNLRLRITNNQLIRAKQI